MGFLQKIGLLPTYTEPPSSFELAGPIFGALANQIEDLPVEQLWAEQPHLRTVTDFIARNIASVSMHVYRREDDGGRERVRDTKLARWVKRSAPEQLTYDLIYGSVMDLCLYDECIWAVIPDEVHVRRIAPTWVREYRWKDPWTLRSIVLSDDKTGLPMEIPAENIVRISGYTPGTMKHGTTPVRALKDTLKEQLEAASYRAQLWRNGPRLGGVIERPQGANWTNTQRQRFLRGWRSQYSGRGSVAGGTPVLEDGMTFKPYHLKANDEKVVEVTKLSKETVASIYHVNPVMVGMLDNSNYSNVREFRKSLYGDSLGPVIKKLEDTINQFLLPKFGMEDGVYVEFNLEEKLRANFEEKAAVTSQAVGGPWMTRNEARAQNNLPAVEGGDDLIVPLNVQAGQNDDPTGAYPSPPAGGGQETEEGTS